MNIDVKHIFLSDLDPNSTAWWSQDKIDKINYNFGLLSLGGPFGPQGAYGSNGSVGYPGDTGYVGPQGFDGHQGIEGTPGAEPWKKVRHNDNTDNAFLFPKYNGLPEDETDVTRVIFSDYISSWSDGTQGSQGILDSGDILTTENSPVDFYDAIWGIYTHDPNLNNLEFREPNVPAGAVIDLYSDGTNDILEFFNQLQINLNANGLSFNDYEKVDNWLTVDINEFKVNSTESIFDQSVRNIGAFKYQNNPSTGYILSADNANGQVSWKDKLDVFDGLPIGSVVSIPCDYLNSNNFYLNESLSSSQSNQSTLLLRYGRGKDKFKGWYLCNGKTWSKTGFQYEVPNLNSFTYTISSNNNGQVAVSGGDDTAIIIGGAKAHVDGQLVSTSTYDTNITVTGDDIEIILASGNADYYRTRNIHIVYLKEPDLTWSDNVTSSPLELEGTGTETQPQNIGQTPVVG